MYWLFCGIASAQTGTSFHRYVSSRTFGNDSQEFRIANNVVQRLTQSNRLPNFQWGIVEKREDIEHIGRPVWVLAPVIRALQSQPGKLAFVIAHDIAQYDVPDKIDNRPVVCTDNPEKTFAVIGDPRNYAVRSRIECESMADSIAIKYMASAGYSPFDASAFLGNVTAGPYIKMEPQWVQDYVALHPTNNQRADRLRQLVVSFCSKNAQACHMPIP